MPLLAMVLSAALAVPSSGAVGVDVNRFTDVGLPTSASFGVVAATGRFDTVSPRLADQWRWAAGLRADAQLYVTPANPGPGGVFWGKGGRKPCAGQVDTAGCAYDYGQRGTEALVATLRASGLTGITRRRVWWIDIESTTGAQAVTWNERNRALNAEVVRGVRDTLLRSGVASSVGIYTTSAIWDDVIAPTPREQVAAADLASLPVWAVGGRSASAAQARRVCTRPTPTGGPIVQGQSIAPGGSTSVDVVCPARVVGAPRASSRGSSVVRGVAFPGSRVRVRIVQRGRAARVVVAAAGAKGTWAVTARGLAPGAPVSVSVLR